MTQQIGIEEIFRKKYKPELDKQENTIKRCNELANNGYYTEAFLAMWIRAEIIAKDIQATYRISKNTNDILEGIISALSDNQIDLKNNNKLRDKLINNVFSAMKDRANKETIQVNDMISGLKFVASIEIAEDKIKILLASKFDNLPEDFPSKKTIRERRNSVVHTDTGINEFDFKKYKEYFDYFFLLTGASK